MNLAFNQSSKILKDLIDDFITPTLNSINVFPNNDLVDMAELLIRITALKRKLSMDLETVGGNINVVVISKCDGFKWKKYNDYFNIILNY